MSSPPPRLRRSPKRRALHERSNSHANEIAKPTLRVVGDSDAKIYASTPYPTVESQILSPRGRRVFDPGLVSVSPESQPTSATPRDDRPSDLISDPDHEQPRYSARNGSHSESPQPGTGSPSSHYAEESPQTPEPSSSIGVDRLEMDGGIVHEEPALDEIVQLPSVHGGRGSRDASATISAPATPNHGNRASLRAIASVASQLSVDSTGSSDTVVVRRDARGPPDRGSYALFPAPPRPGSSRSTRSFSTPTQPEILDVNRVSLSPVSSTSPTSPVSPLSPDSPKFPTPPSRVYQAPAYAESNTAVDRSRPSLQYPVIRPAISGTRAVSGFVIPRRPLRMSSRIAEELRSSHLSTIQSEGTDERNSGSEGGPRTNRRSSITSSLAVDRSSVSSYYPPVPPKPAFTRSRDFSNSTIRVVDEAGDDISNLPTPILRGQASGFFSLPAERDSNRNSHYSVTRSGAGSRGSFLRDSIPQWARYFHRDRRRPPDQSSQIDANTNTNTRIYYSQDNRNNLQPTPASEQAESRSPTSRPQTRDSQSSFPYVIFRPRPRPRDLTVWSSSHNSMAITPVTDNNNNSNVDIEAQGSPRRKTSPSWSPHLWHDRRSAANRRTIFIAPSLDEAAEGKALSRRSAQIWLFIAGFIFAPGTFFLRVA